MTLSYLTNTYCMYSEASTGLGTLQILNHLIRQTALLLLL